MQVKATLPSKAAEATVTVLVRGNTKDANERQFLNAFEPIWVTRAGTSNEVRAVPSNAKAPILASCEPLPKLTLAKLAAISNACMLIVVTASGMAIDRSPDE